MAKKTITEQTQFLFFTHLFDFYRENKRSIRRSYRELTKKYLDFNDPENPNAFLRLPQFEALEMYVFLKEFLNNATMHAIFKSWSEQHGKFENRSQLALFESVKQKEYEKIFKEMVKNARDYPNYIFALTMGTGKTILMATCIFYEFLLANKFPKDERYCHNALVFAPDKTVLQSLKEIQTFDMGLVVPPEYVNFLQSNIRFHFLEDTRASLGILEKSRFNLVITNTQKIILKRQNKDKTAVDELFGASGDLYQQKPENKSIYDEYADLYEVAEPDDEKSLTTNQRFEKLRRIEQLGIYVDEAHHAFGNKLARDMGIRKSKTSLRVTIDELAASLKANDTRVVACYNYTGTPYVGNRILPEVVYAYGLQDAIDNGYLKKVEIHSYTNPKSDEFVEMAVDQFLEHNTDERHEGMLPKLAFFAATIDELENELRPAVEQAIAKHNLPASKILVNVGDSKLTTNEDIREFNRLDSIGSEKQFILLVNKGREGWNCRSLFGVALFRKPRSKIFVLQATMRCLRSIGEGQQTGQVFLSKENVEILQDELRQNFRISVDEFTKAGTGKIKYQVRPVPPPVTIKLKRVHKRFDLREKPFEIEKEIDLKLRFADREKYQLLHTVHDDIKFDQHHKIEESDVSRYRVQREFSTISLCAEIARYLNRSPFTIEEVLAKTTEGIDEILRQVNEHNELLYDWIIPHLFDTMFEIEEHQDEEEFEVELVKQPEQGFYEVSAAEDMTVRLSEVDVSQRDKSFHLDTYCFDSNPERDLFWRLLGDRRVEKLYFTGMLTHGQSDFFIQYIDPDSHTIRSYYPDFVIQQEDGSYTIVEVKGDNKIDDPVVLAKQAFAESIASASKMQYRIIKGTNASRGAVDTIFIDVQQGGL